MSPAEGAGAGADDEPAAAEADAVAADDNDVEVAKADCDVCGPWVAPDEAADAKKSEGPICGCGCC